MKNLSLRVVSSVAVLSLLASCGGGDSKSGKGARKQEEVAPEDGSNIEGHYQAKFVTLNGQVNGTVPGTANFYRKDDKINAYVRLFAGYPKAWHQQFVYTGSRCPTMNDDTNLDGFIDIAEAEAVVGKILIPLDSDITTQNSGRRFYPLADLSGYYAYERITSFNRLLKDLEDEDSDPNDDMVKLAPGEGLRLSGRVFMALGVAETVTLPDTVATKERRRSFQTLPVVCGVFQKVSSLPGRDYVEGEVVGPVASVEPGQDHPAQDTIPEPTTGGATSGTTTGTNDSDDGHGPVSDGDHTGGTTTGGTTGSHTGGTTGSHTGSTTGGATTGGTTGSSTTGGSTTGGTTGGSSSTSGSSTTTTTTTTGGSSSSSTSTSTGSTTGGFLDSSSGV